MTRIELLSKGSYTEAPMWRLLVHPAALLRELAVEEPLHLREPGEPALAALSALAALAALASEAQRASWLRWLRWRANELASCAVCAGERACWPGERIPL